MVKYSLSKVEASIGSAVVVADFLILNGHSIEQAIGYGILAGIVGYFGKHFVSNSLANEKAIASDVKPPVA